jgi:L-iditol 2-dehydrogenase
MKILGFNRDGGFAEVLALPPQSLKRGLNLLPEGADPAIYALTEPLACCVSGQEAARVSEGDVVLILGGGPIGLLHAMLARSAGCDEVIITEKLPQRISLAGDFADRVVDVRFEPLADAVAVETEGLGVDVILAATPEADIDPYVIDLLAPRGRVCVFCGPRGGGIPDLRMVHYRELSIVGTYGCSSRHCRTAVQMIASGEIKPGRIITMRAPLGSIGEALDHARGRVGLKAVIDDFR